jgi:hypothetical protein
MPILINRSFTEITPESVEDGEHSDCGMLAQDEPYSFRELVRLMRNHREPSCRPARGETYEWYSSGFDTTDYRTSTERETSIHFSRTNPERMARYWRMAAIAAGIVRAQS